MNWQKIRAQYPSRWLLVEAYGAYTEGGKRVIPHLEVIAEFGDDSNAAWARYKALHGLDREREYYIYHTAREDFTIGVLDALRRKVKG